LAVALKRAMQGKKCLSMADILLVDRVKVTFGKRKVINGIEQIGLAGSIIADKTVYPVRESHFLLSVILEIYDFQRVKMHDKLTDRMYNLDLDFDKFSV
jgi:hypothetical protein